MAKQNKPAIRFKGFTDAWEQRKLGEIVEIKDSARIPNNEWSDIGVPYIRASDISSENLKGTLFISSERYEFYKNKTGAPMRGDVLFNGGGEIGKSIICNDSKPIYVQGGAVLYARTSASNELEASYLKTYYETSHSRKYIDAASAGGTMKHFTLKPAQEMPVYLPEAEEQKQIGDFYICIDHLITLHQRKYDKLQILKKAMLEKMFPKNGSSVPEIRFKGFTDAWEQRKFSDITFPAGEKNKENLPLESYSITNESGFVPQDEKFENGGTMREADKRMYYIVSPNSFAYNPARINVGSIGYQDTGKSVIVSSLYEVFKTSDDVDDRLLWHWFKSPDFQKLIMQLQEGGVRLYFYYDKLCMGQVFLPSLEEQRKIGKLFDTLDHLITLHQRELEKLQNIKKSMLEKMFV